MAWARNLARQVVDIFLTFWGCKSVVSIYDDAIERIKHHGTVAVEWGLRTRCMFARMHEKTAENEMEAYSTSER